MVTKSKKLLINNPLLKFLSLFILSISLSILFECYFNLIFNFLGESPKDFIPKYYLFGPVYEHTKPELLIIQKNIIFIASILSLLCIFIYMLNKKSSNKLIDFIVYILSKTPLEVILLIIAFIFLSRFDEWKHTMPFYDSDLVYCDSIILWMFYFTSISFKTYNGSIKSRILTIPLINSLNKRYNQNPLLKKLGFLFIGALIVQFLLIFLSLNLLYVSSSSALIETLLISFISSICCSYVYKILLNKVDYIEYIERNIKDIEKGDLEHELDVIGNDELASIAQSVNNISDGLNKALESQLKGERTKTELITNVSHDLKTPLTSIISYIDILKNNELDEQTTKTYIDILDKKAAKLKTLVEDIFEASKISSGDIELHFEKTDIKELLIQSIVELDDKIEASNLDFIIDTPDFPVFSNIDGKRMFRVFDNLITNITKYSLPNTRVYIDVYTNYGYVFISMKNISNHKLNISPNELLERFVRGDVSRNTNGSGLGLSIARNLVEMQDGSLDLDIDGDLFKVTLKFELLNDGVQLEECSNI